MLLRHHIDSWDSGNKSNFGSPWICRDGDLEGPHCGLDGDSVERVVV